MLMDDRSDLQYFHECKICTKEPYDKVGTDSVKQGEFAQNEKHEIANGHHAG